ncbi:MAG: insulinase family protein, partial [Treponemataceae bacterium]
LGANLFTSSAVQTQYDFFEKPEFKTLQGRSWIFFRVKILNEKIPVALKTLFSLIKNPNFSDTKRISDLITEFKNDFDSSVAPEGHQYAAMRASCNKNVHRAIDEIWSGLTQLYFLHDMAKNDTSNIIEKLSSIHKKLLSAGMLLHITSDEEGMELALNETKSYTKDFSFPKPAQKINPDDFFALVNLFQTPEQNSDTECFSASSMQVGFAAMSFPSAPFATKEAANEALLSHFLSTKLLWEKIRTIGGAYGAFSVTDALEMLFTFETYRDPAPEKSLAVFIECLEEAAQLHLDQQSLERLIAGCYSKEVQPRSPASKGFIALIRALYGIDDAQRKRKIEYLIASTPTDIATVAKRLLQTKNQQKSAILTGKSSKDFSLQKKLPI